MFTRILVAAHGTPLSQLEDSLVVVQELQQLQHPGLVAHGIAVAVRD